MRAIARTLALREAGRPPLRVGFLSDLHLGPTTPRTTLDAAFRRVNEAAVDVALLGGDLVFLDATDRVLDELRTRVAGLRAPTKLAVLGNHDLWARDDRIETALRDAGVRMITNDSVRLSPPHDDVAIVGLDDPGTGRPDPDRAFSSVGTGKTTIVLCHAPDGLIRLRDRPWQLYLCGHTHGGHVSTPWGAPVAAGGRLTRRFSSGFFRVGPGTVFVSRGVGSVEVPFRIGAPPDVAVLEITERGDGSLRHS